MRIAEVEGIGPAYADKLSAAGVTTTEDLLERGATSGGRVDLEAATGISGTLILEWVNHVDLMRLDGVGSEYADLLEAAGVDSPAELARRNPANLATTFLELDAARPDWIRRVPSEETIRGWIEQAKSLDRAVFHGGSRGTTAADQTPDEAAATGAAMPGPETGGATTQPETRSAMAQPESAGAGRSLGSEPGASREPFATAPSPPSRPVPSPMPEESPGLWARIKGLFGR